MRIAVTLFKGMMPIIGNSKLPPGYASSAMNCKLTSGDLQAYPDIGNPFTLAKTAPINTVWRIGPSGNQLYLQWTQSEVSYGTNIDVAYSTVPGDVTYRVFYTGLAAGPRQTNLFYATDPSQQGINVLHAYPYVDYPVGIANPGTAPTAVASSPTLTPNNYYYAAQTYLNSASIVAAGLNYKAGDILTVPGGTVVTGLSGATLEVSSVDTTGAITGITVFDPGQYTYGNGPSGTVSLGGGHGTGATARLTVTNLTTFQGFNTWFYDNGAGSFSHWTVSSGTWQAATAQGSASGNLSFAWAQSPSTQSTASQIVWQADVYAQDNGGGEGPDLCVSFASAYNGQGGLLGPRVTLSHTDGTFILSDNNGTAQTVSYTPSLNTWYRIIVTAKSTASASTGGNAVFQTTATVATQAAPGSILATLNGSVTANGEQIGVGTIHRPYDSPHGNVGEFNNLILSVKQPASAATSETTSYVYTYQTTYGTAPNAILQESGPSGPSQTVTFYLQNNPATNMVTMTPITVTIPAAPAGQSISAINLYRLVNTTASGEVYEFVTQLTVLTLTSVTGTFTPNEIVTGGTSGFTATVVSYGSGTLYLSGVVGNPAVGETVTGGTSGAHGTFSAFALTNAETYVDTTLDSLLGNALATEGFQPPPSNLQGIVALPNAVMAGFANNILYLSAQNYPYAYPLANQLATDWPIVAIAPIDTAVLVLTQANPYTAFGTDPSNYQMSKETAPCGCISKRSVATHRQAGVIYASGTGLWAYRGIGELKALTEGLFSHEQWQNLNPSTIIGVVHDDYYMFWYTALNGTKGGYMLDLRPESFGLIQLDFHVTSAYLDPPIDELFFTPDKSIYPINGSIINAASNVLSQWEYDLSVTLRTQVWQRGDILTPRDATFMLARVYAETYAALTVTIASEQGTASSGAVTSKRPFIMAPKPGRQWSITVTGPDQVNSVELVESTSELMP